MLMHPNAMLMRLSAMPMHPNTMLMRLSAMPMYPDAMLMRPLAMPMHPDAMLMRPPALKTLCFYANCTKGLLNKKTSKKLIQQSSLFLVSPCRASCYNC